MAPGPLTHDQETPGPLINNQGAWAPSRQARGYGAYNWQPGSPRALDLTDDQGSRNRGLLMQIFINLHAEPVRNLRVLT